MQHWHELEPALLPLIRAWLEPHGSQGWRVPSGVLRCAEPICAALNLFKLLLLRARHSNCMPGVPSGLQANLQHLFLPCWGFVLLETVPILQLV